MLTALVLHLKALAPGQIAGATGRAVHGLWLDQWKRADPATGDLLHQGGETVKGNSIAPFSLSPLLGLPRPRQGIIAVNPGDLAWLRLTVLTAGLSAALLDRWLPALPETVELAGLTWQVLKPALLAPDQHPWAGQVAYQDLIQERLYVNQPPRKWRLELLTPTAIRAGDYHLPFPLPNSLVASWLRRWQAFAPLALPEELPDRLRQELLVSAYELKTIPVRYGERLAVGCVGWIDLRAANLTPAECAALDLLAAFAFYAGSGHHTTQGMGLTRLGEDRVTTETRRARRKS